ncbi:hypothetical protein OG709_29970 [Streptomyces sp. NBC_01267]|uniref:hypothetical protein n=1 Tax=Streptomyces sp. NBC_01267 TaxID=2903805 RepID=UPI002E381E1E|nr:hypothetical protein [Streptomyces sp. NBC_01267]
MSDDRRERYAAALCKADCHDWAEIKALYPHDVSEYFRQADAAMAVADAEHRSAVAFLGMVEPTCTALLLRAVEQPMRYEINRLRAELETIRGHYHRAVTDRNTHYATIERVRAVLDDTERRGWKTAMIPDIRAALEETS